MVPEGTSRRPDPPGFRLPLLLLAAFRLLVDDLHEALAGLGHDQARPLHGFALQAVGSDGVSVSELGRRLGVSKQAAAKTASGLQRAGYVERSLDPADGRAWLVTRTERGDELLVLSAEIFDRLRRSWADQLGADRMISLERDLTRVTADHGWALDLAGWLGGGRNRD